MIILSAGATIGIGLNGGFSQFTTTPFRINTIEPGRSDNFPDGLIVCSLDGNETADPIEFPLELLCELFPQGTRLLMPDEGHNRLDELRVSGYSRTKNRHAHEPRSNFIHLSSGFSGELRDDMQVKLFIERRDRVEDSRQAKRTIRPRAKLYEIPVMSNRYIYALVFTNGSYVRTPLVTPLRSKAFEELKLNSKNMRAVFPERSIVEFRVNGREPREFYLVDHGQEGKDPPQAIDYVVIGQELGRSDKHKRLSYRVLKHRKSESLASFYRISHLNNGGHTYVLDFPDGRSIRSWYKEQRELPFN